MSVLKRFLNILAGCGAAVALAFGAASCNGSDEDPIADPEVVILTPSVSSDRSSQFITVSAEGEWSLSLSFLSGNDAWASVSPATGTGRKKVVLAYDENTSEDSRGLLVNLVSGRKTASCRLVQAGASSTPSGGGDDDSGGKISDAGWLELPGMTSTEGYDFFHHSMTVGGKTERDYSFYYSYKDLVSVWVAYPLVKTHIGSVGRTDAWGFDPLLPADKQANITRAYWESGAYARGHQLPSADRTADRNMNATTFYSTNMTPQDHTLNEGKWADMENKIRSWANSSDTLYVVTGCVVEGSTTKAHEKIVDATGTQVMGKEVTVPVGYYKVFLRYAGASSVGFGGYMAGAVYFDHNASATAQVMSVDALETKLGMDFFANLPKAVGGSVADQIEAQDPKTVSWWGL